MTRDPLIHRIVLTGFDVEVTLPRDLTKAEATRICNLVMALCLDDERGPLPEPTEDR